MFFFDDFNINNKISNFFIERGINSIQIFRHRFLPVHLSNKTIIANSFCRKISSGDSIKCTSGKNERKKPLKTRYSISKMKRGSGERKAENEKNPI